MTDNTILIKDTLILNPSDFKEIKGSLLIKNDKMSLNWQTPTKVIEYVKNNLEKIGMISFFDIYVTN